MLAFRRVPSLATKLQVPRARMMGGAVKVYDCDVAAVKGPSGVERTEPLHEMGVLYQPGVPSPMESTHDIDVIVVDGLHAKTGGEPLGSPVHYIKLSSWCAQRPHTPSSRPPNTIWGWPDGSFGSRPACCCCRDPTPKRCKYTGLRFVSKQALEHAAH